MKNILPSQLDAISVTVGPGLSSCLKVGLRKAKELCRQWKLPLIPVNHLEGHTLSVRLGNQSLQFPFLLVLVSGGHSQILFCQGLNNYAHLGGTVDDSLGEAYDKVARSIGLTFAEGGSGVEKLAKNGNPQQYILPVGMKKQDNCDLSFSGLKSSVVRLIDRIKFEQNGMDLTNQQKNDIASSFQYAALKQLSNKIEKALQWCRLTDPGSSPTIVVAGGVSRNQELRRIIGEIANLYNLNAYYPPMKYCTDNGVMIAWAAIENYKVNSSCVIDNPIDIENITISSKLPLDKRNPQEKEKQNDYFKLNYPETVKIKRLGLKPSYEMSNFVK